MATWWTPLIPWRDDHGRPAQTLRPRWRRHTHQAPAKLINARLEAQSWAPFLGFGELLCRPASCARLILLLPLPVPLGLSSPASPVPHSPCALGPLYDQTCAPGTLPLLAHPQAHLWSQDTEGRWSLQGAPCIPTSQVWIKQPLRRFRSKLSTPGQGNGVSSRIAGICRVRDPDVTGQSRLV